MLTDEQKRYQSISKTLQNLLPPRKAETKHKSLSVLEYPKPKIKEKHIFSGAPGKDGRDGIDGKDGRNGRMGVDGKDGKDGKDGRDGKDGESVDKEQVREMVLEALEEIKGDNKKILDEAGVDGIVKKHVTDINNRLAQQIATLRGDVMRNYGGHGGSSSSTLTKQYSLSNQLNGVTKSFTIPANTAITAVLGSSAPFVFDYSTDYTGSGTTTLTFTASVDAPSALAAGQTLIVQYQ